VEAPLTVEQELQQAIESYRDFIGRGGNRGSQAGRQRRQHISELVVEAKDAQFKEERITFEDEEDALADVEVFG
jgi:hypothetical protein